ncbi:MAG: ribosome-associated translation inhibitor RaiA [Pseudomonadota bacterium]|nr:ribosome-associated translation inhibitor RaiA [Pseudomonadota bacterium]
MTEYKKISVSGKQTKVGRSLTDHVKMTINSTLKKYFESFRNANIIFSKDTFNFRCEISIHVDGSILIHGNSSNNDAYGAFNLANEKIKKRLRRYHRKLTDHRNKNKKSLRFLKANQYIIEEPETKNLKKDIDEPVIIAESNEIIKTISVSEAMMLMNLKDQNAIFFKNDRSKRLNILYRRTDGNIGWVDPKK